MGLQMAWRMGWYQPLHQAWASYLFLFILFPKRVYPLGPQVFTYSSVFIHVSCVAMQRGRNSLSREGWSDQARHRVGVGTQLIKVPAHPGRCHPGMGKRTRSKAAVNLAWSHLVLSAVHVVNRAGSKGSCGLFSFWVSSQPELVFVPCDKRNHGNRSLCSCYLLPQELSVPQCQAPQHLWGLLHINLQLSLGCSGRA